jgi:hypothetical protein
MPLQASGTAFKLTRGLSLLGLLAFSGISVLQPARAGMVENMIVSKCSEAMETDFKKSGKTPPAGMIDSTCSCVLTRWQQKLGLDTAIKTCTADARTKYSI